MGAVLVAAAFLVLFGLGIGLVLYGRETACRGSVMGVAIAGLGFVIIGLGLWAA